MKNKKQLSDKRKDQLRNKYGEIKPRNKEEQQYLNKIKAGKQRAKNSLRDNSGKYITRQLKEQVVKNLAAAKGVSSRTEKNKQKQIDEIFREANITPKELKTFFELNRDTYEKMVTTGSTKDVFRHYDQLKKDIADYKGKIYGKDKDGNIQPLSKEQAGKMIDLVNNYFKNNFKIVDWAIKPELTFNGKMILTIPDYKLLMKKMKEETGTETNAEANEAVEENEEATELLNNLLEELYDEGEVLVYVSK